MELLIGAAIYALIIQRLWSAARTDHELAKQGIVSPRLQTKYGAAAAAKTATYGFWDFLRDAMAERHEYRMKAMDAAQTVTPAATAPAGAKVSWRDRWAAARAAISKAGQVVANAPVVRAVVDPVDPKPSQPDPEPPVTPPVTDPEPGTVRFTDTGREQWDGAKWVPEPEPTTAPTPAPISKENAVTAPTGEAVNYETTLAELEALEKAQQLHLDATLAALRNVTDLKSNIEAIQQSYRAATGSAGNIAEHLAALHLDAETLGHVGTIVDAMPAGAIDSMYERIEEIEAVLRRQLANAEAALAATRAAIATLQAKYGDAHATVQGELGGDPTFLGNGAAVGSPRPWATTSDAGRQRVDEARARGRAMDEARARADGRR